MKAALALLPALLFTVGCRDRADKTPSAPAVYTDLNTPSALRPALKRADQAFDALAQSLGQRLRAEVTAGGPATAIDVCRLEAKDLTQAVAADVNFPMGRTSHRLRNPANAPRPWARPVVEAAAGKALSEQPAMLVDLGDAVGVLRPIGTQTLCLDCHGAADGLKAPVRSALQKHYPTDRAVGFHEGDLRGFFWAEVPKG